MSGKTWRKKTPSKKKLPVGNFNIPSDGPFLLFPGTKQSSQKPPAPEKPKGDRRISAFAKQTQKSRARKRQRLHLAAFV
jgi:hypothetical protein